MSKELIEWSRIKSEIAEAKDIVILGKLNYSLEAIRKWAKQSGQGLETQNEIAEYRLRLNKRQGEWIEANIPEEGNKFTVAQNAHHDRPTLIEAGIAHHDSPKFRILAKIPEIRFDTYIKETKEKAEEITTNDIILDCNGHSITGF